MPPLPSSSLIGIGPLTRASTSRVLRRSGLKPSPRTRGLFASCDFHDAGAAAAPRSATSLFRMHRHPLPRLRESPVQLTMRLLQNFRPQPLTPPAGAADLSPPASPPTWLSYDAARSAAGEEEATGSRHLNAKSMNCSHSAKGTAVASPT
jgi:hypothetical protein